MAGHLLDVTEPATMRRAREVGAECNRLADQYAHALDERADLVVELRDQNVSVRTIADTLGVSVQNVYRIVDQHRTRQRKHA